MFKQKQLSKRILGVLITTIMLLTTGCGTIDDTKTVGEGSNMMVTEGVVQDTPITETDITPVPEMTPQGESADKTIIKVFRQPFNIIESDVAQVKKIQDAINAYIGDKINVQIELIEIEQSVYKEKAKLALLNGEVDLLWTTFWMGEASCDNIYLQNAAYDLTNILPNTKLYECLPEWAWSVSAYNGKNYFIPIYNDIVEGYDLMFRSDLVTKFGWDLSTVKSLKDIEPMLEDCKAEGLEYPFLIQELALFSVYYLDSFDFFSENSFVAVDRATDTVVNTVQTAEYAEFVTLMSDWREKGYTNIDDHVMTMVEHHETAFTQDWGVSCWKDTSNDEDADNLYWQDIELAKITENYSASYTCLNSCYTISALCNEEKANACVEFLYLLNTDNTLANLYTYGIEGEDYEMFNGEVIKTGTCLYDHSAWESTSIKVLTPEGGKPANGAELCEAHNNSSLISIAGGFRFDTTKVKASYEACLEVYQELGLTLESGGIAPEQVSAAIHAYQDALDAAGYQEVLKEAQAQYEAWKTVR